MKTSVIAGVALAALLGMSGAGSAQGLSIGRDGVRILPPGYEAPLRHRERLRDEGISERQAIRIARRNGLREVESVRSRRDSIRVVGYDRRDNEIRVVVDRYSGDVIDVDRRWN